MSPWLALLGLINAFFLGVLTIPRSVYQLDVEQCEISIRGFCMRRACEDLFKSQVDDRRDVQSQDL